MLAYDFLLNRIKRIDLCSWHLAFSRDSEARSGKAQIHKHWRQLQIDDNHQYIWKIYLLIIFFLRYLPRREQEILSILYRR